MDFLYGFLYKGKKSMWIGVLWAGLRVAMWIAHEEGKFRHGLGNGKRGQHERDPFYEKGSLEFLNDRTFSNVSGGRTLLVFPHSKTSLHALDIEKQNSVEDGPF